MVLGDEVNTSRLALSLKLSPDSQVVVTRMRSCSGLMPRWRANFSASAMTFGAVSSFGSSHLMHITKESESVTRTTGDILGCSCSSMSGEVKVAQVRVLSKKPCTDSLSALCVASSSGLFRSCSTPGYRRDIENSFFFVLDSTNLLYNSLPSRRT